MKKNILLVVDTQYDFMMSDGALYVPDSEEIIIPLIKYVKNINPDLFGIVYYTMDTHSASTYADSEEAKQFPPHCLMGTPGYENVINIELTSGVVPTFVQNKGVFDMWEEESCYVYNPWDLAAGIDRNEFWETVQEATNIVYVCGVATDVCVYQAVRGLLARGFTVAILEDLTRGILANVDKFVLDFPEQVSTGQLLFTDVLID